MVLTITVIKTSVFTLIRVCSVPYNCEADAHPLTPEEPVEEKAAEGEEEGEEEET